MLSVIDLHRAVAQWADHDPAETRTKGKVSSLSSEDSPIWSQRPDGHGVTLKFKVELIFLGPSQ